MAFDLRRIREELAASPLASPYPLELAAAILSDCFRLAGVPPIPEKNVTAWSKDRSWGEQLGMLAHIIAVSSVGPEAIAALRATPPKNAADAVDRLREAIAPLTAEMIRANAFRQEEALRRLIATVGGQVQGETAATSARRLDALDYRKALAEYDKAGRLRKEEAERREKRLKEAVDREAAARGWRE